MAYSVWIKDRRTQEIVRYECPELAWEEGSEFWWSEGNFGCDCNRHLCFMRAKGIEPRGGENRCDYADFPDGGRFQVVSIKLPDGTEVYAEPFPPQ